MPLSCFCPMPFKEHPAFHEPDDESTPVWRYYTSTQLISIFQNRGLYFNRADNFSDPFEGVPHLDALTEQYIQSSVREKTIQRLIDEEIAEVDDDYNPPPPKDQVLDFINAIRRRSFLNCWHHNTAESITMWNSYVQSGDGVLIRSTYEKLKSALDIHGDFTYYMGKVGYLPWLEEGTDEHFTEREKINFYSHFMNKQEEYKAESEFRIVANLDPRELKNSESGFFMPSELDEIIDEVRISPDAPPWCSVDLWENILRKYKVRADVRQSSLNETPYDLLDNLVDDDEIEDEIDERYQDWVRKEEYLDT